MTTPEKNDPVQEQINILWAELGELFAQKKKVDDSLEDKKFAQLKDTTIQLSSEEREALQGERTDFKKVRKQLEKNITDKKATLLGLGISEEDLDALYAGVYAQQSQEEEQKEEKTRAAFESAYIKSGTLQKKIDTLIETIEKTTDDTLRASLLEEKATLSAQQDSLIDELTTQEAILQELGVDVSEVVATIEKKIIQEDIIQDPDFNTEYQNQKQLAVAGQQSIGPITKSLSLLNDQWAYIHAREIFKNKFPEKYIQYELKEKERLWNNPKHDPVLWNLVHSPGNNAASIERNNAIEQFKKDYPVKAQDSEYQEYLESLIFVDPEETKRLRQEKAETLGLKGLFKKHEGKIAELVQEPGVQEFFDEADVKTTESSVTRFLKYLWGKDALEELRKGDVHIKELTKDELMAVFNAADGKIQKLMTHPQIIQALESNGEVVNRFTVTEYLKNVLGEDTLNDLKMRNEYFSFKNFPEIKKHAEAIGLQDIYIKHKGKFKKIFQEDAVRNFLQKNNIGTEFKDFRKLIGELWGDEEVRDMEEKFRLEMHAALRGAAQKKFEKNHAGDPEIEELLKELEEEKTQKNANGKNSPNPVPADPELGRKPTKDPTKPEVSGSGGGGGKPPENRGGGSGEENPDDESFYNSTHGRGAYERQSIEKEDATVRESTTATSKPENETGVQKTDEGQPEPTQKIFTQAQEVGVRPVQPASFPARYESVSVDRPLSWGQRVRLSFVSLGEFLRLRKPGSRFLAEQRERGVISQQEMTSLYSGQKQINTYDHTCLKIDQQAKLLKVELDTAKKNQEAYEKSYKEYQEKGFWGKLFSRNPQSRYYRARAQVGIAQARYNSKLSELTSVYNSLTSWKNERTAVVDTFAGRIESNLKPVEATLQLVQEKISQYTLEIQTFETDVGVLEKKVAHYMAESIEDPASAAEKQRSIKEAQTLLATHKNRISELKAKKQKEEAKIVRLTDTINGYKDRIAQFKGFNQKIAYAHTARTRETVVHKEMPYDIPGQEQVLTKKDSEKKIEPVKDEKKKGTETKDSQTDSNSKPDKKDTTKPDTPEKSKEKNKTQDTTQKDSELKSKKDSTTEKNESKTNSPEKTKDAETKENKKYQPDVLKETWEKYAKNKKIKIPFMSSDMIAREVKGRKAGEAITVAQFKDAMIASLKRDSEWRKKSGKEAKFDIAQVENLLKTFEKND